VLPRPTHGPLDAIPLIGFQLVDAIREGLVTMRGGVAAFTSDGVRFSDGSAASFDVVILATGFAPALAPLDGLVRLDDRGFARRSGRVASADQPDLFFVGHNYDAAGGLYNIARDARLVGQRIADRLVATPAQRRQ
jgi:NAD(P)H-nitrite reductase large subunit